MGVTAVVCVLGLALGGDWLYGTVSPVPMNTAAIRVPEGFGGLSSPGAVMAVPVDVRLPPEAHLWMGVVLHRPVVGYCQTDIDEMRVKYRLVDYAQGGGLPDPSQIQEELQRLSEQGISYLAFVVPEPGRDRFERAHRRITRLMGPADAQGDGVIGYRTKR